MLNAASPVTDGIAHEQRRFCRTDAFGQITVAYSHAEVNRLCESLALNELISRRYRLLQVLGQGGMGRVYQAVDLKLEREVALKVVPHVGYKAAELQRYLEREARLAASLNHRAIAAVYDVGFVDETAYIIFELVDGDNLRTLLNRRTQFSIDEVAQVVLQLAEALDFAHIKGIVHRDLKPENVCCSKQGELKILDFGLARDIRHGQRENFFSGTPAYSSPEQARCEIVDARSDQYSLAVMAFELLTGKLPFAGNSVSEMLKQHASNSAPGVRAYLPSAPESVEQALLRAMAKSPDERFATCQKFASELCSGTHAVKMMHLLPTPVKRRLSFYMAYATDDFATTRQLSNLLERNGYRVWLCNRDAVAGVPLASQISEVLHRCQAVIAIISQASLTATEFSEDLALCYRLGIAILPVLLNMSSDDLAVVSPAWCRMLSDSPALEIRSLEEVEEWAIPWVDQVAQQRGIFPSSEPVSKFQQSATLWEGQTWATDANQIDVQDLDRVLFRSPLVDQFLTGKHKHFIAASKGFGKTLLLTCKRQLLEKHHPSHGASLTMIPAGRPYLDFMSELRTLSQRYMQSLSDLATTTRLWSMALRIAIISHHPSVIDASEEEEFERFPRRVQRWMAGNSIQPTVVFKELTSLTVRELNQLMDGTENFLDQQLRQIHSATYVFIDKVDQATGQLNRDAWVAVQAGLLEASWEIMNANSHIKIFGSIRQEALANYRSDTKSNLYSAITSLDYSDEELRLLVDRLAQSYEGCTSFADFIGMNVIRPARRSAPEDSYQYVLRHTCGRPRDLVAIASELSDRRPVASENRLRELVQRTCASVLAANAFDEVAIFLNCLNDPDQRYRFLGLLPANALTHRQAIEVCERFNGLEPGTMQHFDHNSDQLFHPFQDMYFAGLLGIVQRDSETNSRHQRFRKPHESLGPIMQLPESEVYLLHPALVGYFRFLQVRQDFLQFEYLPVGENLTWETHYPLLMQIEQTLRHVPASRSTEAAHELIQMILSLRYQGSDPIMRNEIYRSPQWLSFYQKANEPPFDEVCFAIADLIDTLL